MREEYTARKAGVEDAALVKGFYEDNIGELHGAVRHLSQWRSALSSPDPDEQNYIILRGDHPVGWFRIEGLGDIGGTLWLAMLSIGREHKHQGAGKFAVDFTEDYARTLGYTALGIHTCVDNLPGRALYESRGLVMVSTETCTNGDGQTREGCTYRKALT